jgi:hypothetical protein
MRYDLSLRCEWLCTNCCQALTPQTTELPEESTEPTLYSALKTQSDLHIHTNRISNRLLADPGLSAEEALAISASMDAWSHTMPSYFQLNQQSNCQHRWYSFAKSRSWWRFWNLKIIVFRHILLRRAISERGQIPDPVAQAKQEECTRLCIDAANATVTSIHQYAVQGLTRLEGWYATYAFTIYCCHYCSNTYLQVLPLSRCASDELVHHQFPTVPRATSLASSCSFGEKYISRPPCRGLALCSLRCHSRPSRHN